MSDSFSICVVTQYNVSLWRDNEANWFTASRCCQYHKLCSGDGERWTEWYLKGGGRGLVIL